MTTMQQLRDEFTDAEIKRFCQERYNLHGVALSEHGISFNGASDDPGAYGWYAVSEDALEDLLATMRREANLLGPVGDAREEISCRETTMTETEFVAHLDALAAKARPLDGADWGSERQIEAENVFDTFVEAHMQPMAFAEYCDWALKATTDERIDYAVRLLKEVVTMTGRPLSRTH